VPELFDVVRISEHGMSHLSDNVLLLQYVRTDSRISRALAVLKTRASHHEPEVRSYEISGEGIVLGPPLAQSATASG
jgi:circadian clock protein KaiC